MEIQGVRRGGYAGTRGPEAEEEKESDKEHKEEDLSGALRKTGPSTKAVEDLETKVASMLTRLLSMEERRGVLHPNAFCMVMRFFHVTLFMMHLGWVRLL